MKTILCPIDFSKNSENAVRYAKDLNKNFNAKIILLFSFETPVLYFDAVSFTPQFDYQMLYENASNMFKEFVKKHFSDYTTGRIEMIMQQGLASSRICEIALERKVDMIIMGATGTGAAERLILGSNASRVVKNAPCKVMLIPGKSKFDGLKKFVYATDLSDDNINHAKEIFHMAKKLDSEVLFLLIDNKENEKEQDLLDRVSRKIKKSVAYGKKSGYVCTDPSVSKGVHYFLKKQKGDCLVLFHRHRTIFNSIYKPSLSKKIPLHVSIPVMIIHENDFIE